MPIQRWPLGAVEMGFFGDSYAVLLLPAWVTGHPWKPKRYGKANMVVCLEVLGQLGSIPNILAFDEIVQIRCEIARGYCSEDKPGRYVFCMGGDYFVNKTFGVDATLPPDARTARRASCCYIFSLVL